ncbi:MAG TPA: hypothetical protein DEP71_00535, partial [Porphyromonadaceae bacterium]|nr:hypothetical protein [Porphyromonadaceae bacterium]
ERGIRALKVPATGSNSTAGSFLHLCWLWGMLCNIKFFYCFSKLVTFADEEKKYLNCKTVD